MNELDEILNRSFPDTLLLLDRRAIVHAAVPGSAPRLFADDPTGRALGHLWPTGIATQVSNAVRRVLKTREAHCIRLTLPATGGDLRCELRLLVHGRERVLLLIRDLASMALEEDERPAGEARDSTTGLPGRAWFEAHADDRFNEARLREESVGVLLIEFPEIDGINTTFGRSVGAELMKVAAARIAGRVRRGREQTPGDKVAQVARDALAMLVSPVTGRDQLESVAARIREVLEAPLAWQGREFTLRSSLGVALFPRDGTDVESLLGNAHVALAETPADAGSPAFFSDTIPVRSLARLDVQDELRFAIEQGGTAVRYTPWLRISPHRVAGLTVSPVLESPVRGTITPDRLVSYAEATGLAGALFARTLDAALTTVPRLLPQDLTGRRARIRLDLQIAHLRPELPSLLEARCRHHGVSPVQVHLSVPGNTLLQGEAVEVLSALGRRGLRVILRDFGATPLRLVALDAQPLWGVALAGDFLRGLASRSGRRSCAAAIQLARSLDLEVIATTVRREREAQLLVEYGCTELSGHHYGEQLSEADVNEAIGHTPSSWQAETGGHER